MFAGALSLSHSRASVGTGVSECSEGAVHHGRCWMHTPTLREIADAREACHRWGGELVSVNDNTDHALVTRLMDPVLTVATTREFFCSGCCSACMLIYLVVLVLVLMVQ